MTTSTSTLLTLCCIITCFCLTQAKRPELDKDWEDFKTKHQKNYTSQAHENQGRAAFETNHDNINKHNSNSSRSFDLGHNQYSDMTIEEVRQRMNGHRPHNMSSDSLLFRVFEADSDRQLAATVDWRNNGYVTPVKNQGQCGACWTFATTGVIEGQLAKSTGKLVSLSEQQLVDCDTKTSDSGCNGGNAEVAYGYVHTNAGLDTETCYPYSTTYTNANSITKYTCRYSTSCNSATVAAGYTKVASGNEASLMTALTSVGPIAIAIDASHTSFQLYKSGVYSEPACKSSSNDLDHAVLLVGYGTYNNSPVWIIKNSWGTSWGVAGYMYMARNANNMCGVATDATYPTGPFTVSGGFTNTYMLCKKLY